LPKVSLTAEHVTMPGDTPYEYRVSGSANYIALHDIVLADGELVTDTGKSSRYRDLRGKMTYVPAGTPVRGWGEPIARRNSFTAIYFGADAIPEALAGSSIWENERVYFSDVRLANTLGKLNRALHADEPFMDLLGETLCDLAILELACSYQSSIPSIGDRPALRSSDIARVREFIMSRLADDISLSDLAQVVGLSKYYFCRAYKSATGHSPYRDILMIRVETARIELMQGTSIQVAAARTGFSNVSQFSRTFKQFAGLPPSAYAKLSH
jgi:AraC family transcriptional regulator